MQRVRCPQESTNVYTAHHEDLALGLIETDSDAIRAPNDGNFIHQEIDDKSQKASSEVFDDHRSSVVREISMHLPWDLSSIIRKGRPRWPGEVSETNEEHLLLCISLVLVQPNYRVGASPTESNEASYGWVVNTTCMWPFTVLPVYPFGKEEEEKQNEWEGATMYILLFVAYVVYPHT